MAVEVGAGPLSGGAHRGARIGVPGLTELLILGLLGTP